MEAHSRILAWRIPWTEEPLGLHRLHRQWSIRVAKSQTRLKRLSMYMHTSMNLSWISFFTLISPLAIIFSQHAAAAAAASKSLQLCPTLCDPRDGSPPGDTAIYYKEMLSELSLSIAHTVFVQEKVSAYACSVTQVVSNSLWPMDGFPPGSSVHWIFQARILVWITISYSWRSLGLWDWTHISCISSPALACIFFTTGPPGKPHFNSIAKLLDWKFRKCG